MVEPNVYTVGGTVQANERGVYIPRQADADLLQLCRASAFAYVLTARQTGKSSLMIRTAEQLIDEGIQAVIIDLTQIGTQITVDQWYSDFLDLVASQLLLPTNVKQWWQDHHQSGITRRLIRFFQEVVLAEVTEPIVVFVDEIDTTLSLSFTDDFYAAIRYLYVARSTDSEFSRLSFVLIGVATPADLIRDPKRTPFNIGQRVDLTDFTVEEALPLAMGLGLPLEKSQQVLGWVLKWTGGHPYLTQRFYCALVDQRSSNWTEAAIDRVMANTFLGGKSEQDHNLQFVRDMLTKRAPDSLEQEVLHTYRDIYRGKRSVPDEEQNRVKSHLKLSGVVRRENQYLKVRNRIYRQVFNQRWIKEHLPENLWQRLKPAMPLIVSLLAFSVLTSGLAIYAFAQQQRAEEQTRLAQLREQIARILYLLPTADAVYGMVLAIDTMNRSQSIPAVEIAAQSTLLSALQLSQEINQFHHESFVNSVAFSLDGKRIVSGSADKTVRIWDAQTGQPIGQPLRHESFVNSAAFSPDGKYIVSGSADKTVQIWNAQTGQPIGYSLWHESFVNSVAFSPDGRRIVSGSADKTVRIWNAQTGQLIGQPLRGHEDSVSSVAFSPDGKRIVSGSIDKTIRIWNAQTGQLIGQPLRGHEDSVSSVAFSPDGKRIVSGSIDKTMRIWDAQTGQTIGQPLRHESSINWVAFSPDGKRLVSGSYDNGVRIWDTQTGQPIGHPLRHGSSVNSVAFSPDGKRIVSGSADKTVRIWQAQTGQPINQILQGHRDAVSSAMFSPDGKRVVSGSADRTVRIWNAQTGQIIGQPLQGHEDVVTSVAFSPDGKRIVSGSIDKTVRIWNTATGQAIGQPLRGHEGAISSVAFSPDGKQIVSGSIDKTVRIWNTATGQAIGQPLRHNSFIVSAVFSSDGKRIMSGSYDDMVVQIWDAQTGQSLKQLRQQQDSVANSVAFSPDGKRIISGSYDSTVRIWDAQTGQLIGQPLQGHENAVNSVEFSFDGKRIVSGSIDRTVRIWDAQTGQVVGQPLQGHRDTVHSVAFSPDGKRIVSGSADKTLLIWDVSPENWLAIACNRLRHHPLLMQPETITTDPEFLQAAQQARSVCQQRVW